MPAARRTIVLHAQYAAGGAMLRIFRPNLNAPYSVSGLMRTMH
jgi:hypothetical protein